MEQFVKLKTQKTQKTHLNTKGLGNTYTKPKKKVRGRRWALTLNNYTIKEFDNLKNTLNTRIYKFVIGEEIGEQGTPHLQIYLESKNAIDFDTLKNINDRLHIEKAKQNRKTNLLYCMKDGKFITNFEEHLYKDLNEMILESEYKDFKPKIFQKRILDIIDGEVNKRKIYWFWETNGNIGKSYILKYIALKYENKVIIGNGKMNDVFNQIRKHLEDKFLPEIILIDCPRDYAEEYFNYGGLENIKNGMFYSGKYEGGRCLFKIPHIIVVANEEPNYEKLSKDRYDVCKVDGINRF